MAKNANYYEAFYPGRPVRRAFGCSAAPAKRDFGCEPTILEDSLCDTPSEALYDPRAVGMMPSEEFYRTM